MEGQEKRPEDTTKGQKINTALRALDGAVTDIEEFAEEISGDTTAKTEDKGEAPKSSGAVSYLLSGLPGDLNDLTARLAVAKENIRASLY